MSVLPQLERDLLEAAEAKLAAASKLAAESKRAATGERAAPAPRARVGVHGLARRLRVPVIALACLLAGTTIALAASGVILTGAPVRPEELLNPDVGEGVPAAGASRLLGLRVPDPEGGLPWGMRIVRTTRDDLCVQVGRVQNGQLGELGIDGAFHDDGRFHPMSAAALPADAFHGHVFGGGLANANTSCGLTNEASIGYSVGVERSAAASIGTSKRPLHDLRDVYSGILGPQAVSISYLAGKQTRTLAVLPPMGAYLIVRRTAAGQQVGTGGASIGAEGDLSPSPPLTTITYRLDGKLCQRGLSLPPGERAHLSDPCPWPHYSHSPLRARDLGKPPRVRLLLHAHTVSGAEVRFTAPFAVTSAHQEYTVAIPVRSCKASGSVGEGMVVESLARDVKRGAVLSTRLSYPFANSCGRRAVTIEVFYQRAGEPRVLVGATTVAAPTGTRLQQPQQRRRRRRRAG